MAKMVFLQPGEKSKRNQVFDLEKRNKRYKIAFYVSGIINILLILTTLYR